MTEGIFAWDEAARLAALGAYDILDTPVEADFDDITVLAAEALEAPIAVVNLIADGRQWFKSEVGIGVRELPLEVSICAHAILQTDTLVVPDTTLDSRFACNPLVTADNGLRFCAGALLTTPDGLPIGTVCVLDRTPRPDGLTLRQRHTLEMLARQVMALLELRRLNGVHAARAEALEREAQDRHLAQAAQQQSEDRYRSLFNSLDSGFCVIEMAFDHEGVATDYRFVETNPAFAAQTGLGDVRGRWMRDIAPDHEQHWFDAYGRVVTTGEPVRFENAAAAFDGRWYDVHAFRIGAEGARQVAVLFNDITKRRQAELHLQELNVTLDARVAQAVLERERVEDALRQSQKLEAIGQLTGGVAHDFNNLLTVIRGSVDMLRRPNVSEERQARYVDAIGDTADRAVALTKQLLAFARRQALSPEVFDTGANVVEVASMVRTLAGSRVTLDINLPTEPSYVLADRSQFDTAIVNMCINARDAMHAEGKLTVTVGAVSGIPAIRSHPPVAGDFVALTIADTGAGIGPDDLGRIFEPFYTTKSVGLGTGLGLSQVIGFAKQSDGDIRVESVLGVGTTFTLYLPRVAAEDRLAEPKTELGPPTSGVGVCVLVVEDNAQVGEFATQALRELGYETVLAPDAQHALEVLGKDCNRFHIVFSDVVMPGMSGLDLAQEIRRLYPDVPVILTSGYSHVLAQNGRHGFELLHKPYSVEQIARVFAKALAWQKALRQSALA